jgi:enoyl-CoA hydratase/carnithine racemase
LVAEQLDGSEEVRCVVLTGAGGAFCSGADLSGAADDRHQLARMRQVNRVVATWHELPQPTIAKVTGVAAGAGMALALGCDLVVASDEARFSQIFVKRGLSVDGGSSWLLPRLIGLHRAKELALFGDIIDAAEARALGLVNRIVPAAEIDGFVAGWADRLATGPPIALAMTKRMLNRAFETSFEQALDAEGVAQTVNFGTGDTAEAISAFLEKREPRFRGR